MKRYVVDRETLGRMYPPMDERFERNMRAMIDTLPSRGERRRAAIKPRYALAIALLLVVLAATALAAFAVHRGFLGDVARLNQLAGAYDDWTLSEKESLVQSMKEYGVLADMAPWDEALAIASQEKREKALDALFSERYGINGRTDVITAAGIVEMELGLYDPEWPLEKKAAYTQLMLELDLLGYDTNIDFLPDEDDIPQEQAIAIAKKAVQEAYGYDDAAMGGYDIWAYFVLHRSEVGVKEPYYMLEFTGPGLEYHVVYVSGDGKVLTSADGYKGITSPKEDAAQEAARKKAEETPEELRLAEHVDGLPLLDAETYLRPDRFADGVIGLADGTAAVYGRSNVINGDGDSVFVECVDEHAQTKWLLELPDENEDDFSPKSLMQLDGGDLLMVIERKKIAARNEIEYLHYEQLRIGADGELKERRMLKSISEMAGTRGGAYDQMFATAGHGGMLVRGHLGGKHIPMYAQLDENGEPMFTWQFEELLGYAPYLKVTDEGYVLTAWNEAANASILRFYDKQGQLLHEGENVEGIRVNQVKSCGNGELLVTSNFMQDGQWLLARIDGKGRLLNKQVYLDKSGPILRCSEIVRIDDRYVYASNHHLSPSDGTQHTGIIISDAEGAIREYSLPHGDKKGYFTGYTELAPVGGDCVLLVRTMMDADSQQQSVYLSVVQIPQ